MCGPVGLRLAVPLCLIGQACVGRAGSRLLISNKNVLSVSDQESWIRELGTARGHESCASPLQPCSDGPLVPSIECGDAKSGRLVYSIAFQSYVRHEVHANYPEAAGWRHHSSASMAPFGFAPTCVTCPFSEQPCIVFTADTIAPKRACIAREARTACP
jgi:hypothetical protein